MEWANYLGGGLLQQTDSKDAELLQKFGRLGVISDENQIFDCLDQEDCLHILDGMPENPKPMMMLVAVMRELARRKGQNLEIDDGALGCLLDDTAKALTLIAFGNLKKN